MDHRSTKIVATLGPGTSSAEAIEQLFLAGVQIFRLNFSHGSHDDHGRSIGFIRDVEKKHQTVLAIMADLQGPKLRIGLFNHGPITLQAGQSFRLDLDPRPGDSGRVNLPHGEIFSALSVGEVLLLDDGRIRLSVEECGPAHAHTRVITGGPLSDHKGVNVPTLSLPLSSLTHKDRIDLTYALQAGVDWVALSFVQRPSDVTEARQIIGNQARLLAKLEKPSAIDHLEEIVALSDGIMVARGDLGVELPLEEVPCIQKKIVRMCRQYGKPVIVATQMLESMIHAPSPTRAEASDVASAVYDGADGVMLSAESAVGAYPIQAVQMMDRIIRRVEKDPLYWELVDSIQTTQTTTLSDAITAAAAGVVKAIFAAAVVTLTRSGSTTYRAARERPRCPLIAITPDPHVARQLMMVWGCHPYVLSDLSSFAQSIQAVTALVSREKFAEKGDHIVLTAGPYFADGLQTFQAGTTRVLRIITVGNEGP